MDKQGLQLDEPSFLEGQPEGWAGGKPTYLLYAGSIPDPWVNKLRSPRRRPTRGKVAKVSSGDRNDGASLESEH